METATSGNIEIFDLSDLLLSLLFDPGKSDRITRLIPEVLNKVASDLEVPIIYIPYCKILSVKGTQVSFIRSSTDVGTETYQEIILSLLVVFEESKLIDIKGTIFEFIMEKIA